MAERKYSVSEIDRMRRAITEVVWDQHWSPKTQAPVIEDRLRTYMLNGTEPEELEALSKPIVEKREAEDADCCKRDEEQR
jgi:hypothetical protein